jgi:hypothetical protein
MSRAAQKEDPFRAVPNFNACIGSRRIEDMMENEMNKKKGEQ